MLTEEVPKKKKSEMTSEEKRAEKKRKLKAMFDSTYDMKGDTEFYDNWKEEAVQQAKVRLLLSILATTAPTAN